MKAGVEFSSYCRARDDVPEPHAHSARVHVRRDHGRRWHNARPSHHRHSHDISRPLRGEGLRRYNVLHALR
jgi:hypothetical protein